MSCLDNPEDDPHGYCRDEDFLTQMAKGTCQEVLRDREAYELRVFWNPTSHSNLQERIKSFLLAVNISSDGWLVQFWAPPIRTGSVDEGRLLTGANQPFGLDQLFNGLCRYRNHSIKYEDNTWKPVSPVGRAFAGYPEKNIPLDFYSIDEFPLRDYASISCGIKGYLVIPLFEKYDRHPQHCIGVLEILAHHSSTSWFQLYQQLKVHNFAVEVAKSHSAECKESGMVDEIIHYVMKEAREVRKLPLIQLWRPCLCKFANSMVPNSQPNTTQLLWDFKVSDSSLQLNFSFNENYYVENEKSLVGRAYSQLKTCFFKQTDQFSILDYPLVPFTRSWGLTACFAIPLPLIRPDLPPFILEVFLRTQQRDSNGNQLLLLLNKLLSTLSYKFSVYYDELLPKPIEARFAVYFSHSEDDFLFFDVYRDGKIPNMHKAFGRKFREENEKNESARWADHPNAQDKAKSSRRQIGSTNMKYQIPNEESIQQLGKKRARELGVSKTSMKDRCGHLDTANWRKERKAHQIQPNPRLPSGSVQHGVVTPKWSEKSKFHHIQSNPWLPSESEEEEEESGETLPEAEIRRFPWDATASNPTPTIVKGKSVAMRSGNEIDDGIYTMDIVATYQGDNIKIEFSSKSGIEELRRELDECFELEGKKFKIKYEEHGQWIMIPRDKDLYKYMDSLKAKGEDTMNLSIFPAT